MSRRVVLVLVAALAAASPASSDDGAVNGRFSLFASWSDRETADGITSDFIELVGNLSLAPERGTDSRWDYRLDARVGAYPDAEHRDERISIYEAWIGTSGANGRWTLRLGQVWARELGALGRAGGVMGELALGETRLGHVRAGVVAGLEPEIRDAGYEDKVAKAGAYVAVDGGHGRRHVLGWALLRNDGLTERSVVVLTNFIPVKRTFSVYQGLEYDLEGPAGLGGDELTYVFVNTRLAPVKPVEVQATYHRGRSIDTRGIAQDVLDGRPVNPQRLEGLLFESARVRLSVLPWRGFRAWVLYGRDRNNRSDEWSDRLGVGVWANDLLGSGFDLTATRSDIDRADRSYETTSVSIGRSLGARVYASLDYASSLSVFYFDAGDEGLIEIRPESDRYALSVNTTLSRRLAWLLTGEWLDHDDFEELRVLSGLVVRF